MTTNILFFALGAVTWSVIHNLNLNMFMNNHPELFNNDDDDSDD